MPKRVQMTRAKGGWRKDNPDAVIVARPSKWGNPFVIGNDGIPDAAAAVSEFEMWMKGRPAEFATPRPRLAALIGKDLACWCPLDQSCHADVLLKLANEEKGHTNA